MRAVLVVDIDNGHGWTQKNISENTDRQKFACNLKNLLEIGRSKKTKIVFVVWPNGRILGNEFFIRNSFRCAPCRDGGLAEFLGHRHAHDKYEPVFYKNTGNAFDNTNLEKYLRTEGVTEIALAGCLTDCCVLFAANGALRSGFNVVLLKDCVYPSFCDDDEARNWVSVVKSSADASLSVAVE